MRERGFNQSALLAGALSEKLRLKNLSACLRRTGSSRPQHFLDKSAREKNVRGRFAVRTPAVGGKKVLLVDDILTTGQTASECARVLKEAGARSITVLAVARGA